MSYYTERWIKFGKEDTWGEPVTPDKFPNYLTAWSATTTENKTEEDIIAGSRDRRKRVWLERGVVARWTQELVSAKIFEFVLGSKSGTVSPVTFSVGAVLPSMTIYRALYPSEEGGTIGLEYVGMKVDTAELTIEAGEPVELELNFAGKNAIIPTQTFPKPSIDFSKVGFSFFNSSISWKGSPLQNVSRVVLTIDQNLEAQYSAGSGTFVPIAIREGALQVSGRLTVTGNLSSITQDILSRNEGTLQITLAKTGSTITITLRNVVFEEIPDELRGLEPVEWELPFTARPSTNEDAITIVENFSGAFDTLPY